VALWGSAGSGKSGKEAAGPGLVSRTDREIEAWETAARNLQIGIALMSNLGTVDL
jgi:hypothetical protein